MGQCSSTPALPAGAGITAMHAAAASGNVMHILSIGEQDEKCGRVLSINSTDRNASTPLHHAAFEGQLGSVRALLSLGANTRAVNSRKFTPLHLAASQGYTAVVQCLLVADASAAGAQDRDGWTPLMCAAAKGHCNCINLLARVAHNLEARSIAGSTALLLAANAGEANAVRTLLSLGANPAAANDAGCTAAHLAAQCAPSSVHASSFLYILRYLLEKGAPPDARARGGNCPIHLAAAAGSVEAVKLLLHFKADAYVLNEQGLSPLQVAVDKGRSAVVNVLLPLEYPEPAVSGK
ncbi:ankyrin repeat [Chlorella sorokiniana]|uniref:Ankyrin repeat n=1 Tax=Chlorella sorokiniana TaxID=3076 RepID=A0A2P6TUJ3_CHLSO|nr:ankyrin repeat [Chlorella sorokiniana]|eukprot:PRW57737.1 ankyrin repeat [Chlorella sorokiniana]